MSVITYEEAILNADSQNELRLNIKLNSKHPDPAATTFIGKASITAK